MPDLPLIHGFGADAVFSYRFGAPISVPQFLQDVQQLATRLPAGGHVINLCADRYRFSVGFAAALVRGHVNLLPPNNTPGLLGQLLDKYPDAYCLADTEHGHTTLPTMMFPQLDSTAAKSIDAPLLPERQVAALVLTSGSTGEPVPHRKTWGALVRSARAERSRLGLADLPGAVIVGTVPPQHMYGLESTVLLALQGGFAVHAGRPFYPADVCAELERTPRPRGLVTTPVHLRALLAEDTALPPLDFLVCATAPLSPQLAAAAESRFGVRLHEVYGCTEAGQVATRCTVHTAEWQALEGVSLRQDEHGTWVKGGHVDIETLLGDVIELCGPDRFVLHGRTADLVNIAGKRTSLANLNYHLNSIDGVRDGVFVMPDEQGEGVTRLMAFVVAPDLTTESLMQALRRRIDAAFLPRPLRLVAALPRNSTGKLPRHALVALVAELAAEDR
jgi:acyl-coenzyme A synthetase/AMP-(fatty) acid ligase